MYKRYKLKMKAKKWVLVKHFDGAPKDEDLELVEEELPTELNDNEVLVEALYLSVDPYMRPYTITLPVPSTMIGEQLCRVIESKSSDYPVGTLVLAKVGWRTHSILDTTKLQVGGRVGTLAKKLPDLGDNPLSLGLGTLGMPGYTAYFGLLKICEPKEGETVYVNAAAGAVGSLVGQIAKIKGCRVVGCAGTDEKCRWLKEELGFDFVFNYKTKGLSEALKEGAPNGIDCFFDNVGGDATYQILAMHMNTRGRIAVCGAIAHYNDSLENQAKGPYPWPLMIFKQLKMEGFIQSRWADEYPQALKDMSAWIKEGKIKYREHVTEGFKNMRSAFYGMLKGENIGKAIVKI